MEEGRRKGDDGVMGGPRTPKKSGGIGEAMEPMMTPRKRQGDASKEEEEEEEAPELSRPEVG